MTKPQDITDLTLCRAIFALWALVYYLDQFVHVSHVLGPLAGLVSHGYLGVDGFFMLSGLVLLHTHREFDVEGMDGLYPKFALPKWAAVWRFYVQRLGRIYPVYVVSLLLLLGLVICGIKQGMLPMGASHFSLAALPRVLLLTQGWGGAAVSASWYAPAWVLSDLWLAYLLFPLLALLLTYFGRNVALQVAIALFPILGIIYFYTGYTFNLTSGLGLLRLFPEFVLGMTMYRMAMVVADYNGVRSFFLWGGVGLTLSGAVSSCDIIVLPGLWSLIFACYLQHDAQMAPFFGKSAGLLFLGRLSYCLYMSFALAGMLVYSLFLHQGWALATHKALFALGVICITFVLAVVLRGFVELPCRRWVNEWLYPVAPLPPPPASPTITDVPDPSPPSLF